MASDQLQKYQDEPQAESSHRNQDRWEPHEAVSDPAPSAPTRVTRSSARSTSRSGPTSTQSKFVAATIPAGFKFSVDARLEARSRRGVGESENAKTKSTSTSTTKGKGKAKEIVTEGVRTRSAVSRSHGGFPSLKHSVPDFKSLHASNNADLAHKRQKALREGSLHPTVPVAPRFATDARLEERHKFDEKVKERERREKAEREARRRLEEEVQEREIRELRKRAVPKAHEVPQWYKDAPKRPK